MGLLYHTRKEAWQSRLRFRAENGKVSVQEGAGEADTTISASEETFIKIVNGEQNATSAFMMGKLKVSGDLTNAMKLQKLF